MKCVILAAGYATRLYPITENFPKPLLELNGKSIIDWLISDIEENKLVSEFIIISNHKFYNNFISWKDSHKYKDAIKKLNLNDDLMILAGDNLLDFSLASFANYFNKCKSTCIMKYYTEDKKRLMKSANIKIDDDDRVIEMIEKPENPISNWCCPAFYIISKDDIKKVSKALEEGCSYDAPGSFICWLYKNSLVYSYTMPGNRYDIGTIETYNEVKQLYKGINKKYK